MSLVVDASVLSEYLVDSSAGHQAAELMVADGTLHIPHRTVIEVASVLRGWQLGGHVPEARLRASLDDLADLRATRWPLDPLLPRVWDLRSNLSADDAAYVALAEATNSTLLTGDRRLARAVSGLAACPLELLPMTTSH